MEYFRLAFFLSLLALASQFKNTSQFDYLNEINHRSVINRWSFPQGHKLNINAMIERKQKEKIEAQADEKRRVYFRQNLEARLVASSVLSDFYAGRF